MAYVRLCYRYMRRRYGFYPFRGGRALLGVHQWVAANPAYKTAPRFSDSFEHPTGAFTFGFPLGACVHLGGIETPFRTRTDLDTLSFPIPIVVMSGAGHRVGNFVKDSIGCFHHSIALHQWETQLDTMLTETAFPVATLGADPSKSPTWDILVDEILCQFFGVDTQHLTSCSETIAVFLNEMTGWSSEGTHTLSGK